MAQRKGFRSRLEASRKERRIRLGQRGPGKKKKVEFEKWKESGNHKSSEKHLGKIPDFQSKPGTQLSLEVSA